MDWAKEMGIDVTELVKEHPLHPQQLRMKRISHSANQLVEVGSNNRIRSCCPRNAGRPVKIEHYL